MDVASLPGSGARAITRVAAPRIAPLLLAAAFALAGCGGAPAPTPTATQPAPTPTPVSTPLPLVPTVVPPGADGNPVRVVFPWAGDAAPPDAALRSVGAVLARRAGMAVEVEAAPASADALAALCESFEGTANAAWLDGIAYAAAHARGCGTAQLAVARGQEDEARTGSAVAVIVPAEGGAATLAGLTGERVFCRVNDLDRDTWLVPSLLFMAERIRPLYDLRDVRDFPGAEALIAAVAEGECDGAGVPAPVLDAADAEQRAAVRVLTESPDIPFAVLVVPDELAGAEREALVAAFEEMAGDNLQREALRSLLAQDGVRRVTDDDLAGVRSLLARSGVDLSGAGGA